MPRISMIIPKQSGRMFDVNAGEEVRIIDIEGCQVADMFAVCRDNHQEWLSVANTRGVNWKLFPRVGDVFVSTKYRKMLTLVADDFPGYHDAQFSACDPIMYELLGFKGPHANCADNFRLAAKYCGWVPDTIPDPVNFFQRTPVDLDGILCTEPAATRPGNSVSLRAELAITLIVTACSMDIKNINGGKCTSIGIEVTG